MRAAGRKASIRLICPEQAACFTDSVWGEQCLSAAAGGGDFALCRSDGVVAYQLAVVVDDGAMHINQVVRGRDILSSTPRQLVLQRLLGLPTPMYTHVPLLCDHQGERLAKRHQSLSLASLREAGIDPRAVTGYLAICAGLIGGGTDACAARNPAALREKGDLPFLLRVVRNAALPQWWRERDILLDADPLAMLRARPD